MSEIQRKFLIFKENYQIGEDGITNHKIPLSIICYELATEINSLQSRIQKLEEANEYLKDKANQRLISHKVDELEEENTALRQKNEELKKTCQVYSENHSKIIKDQGFEYEANQIIINGLHEENTALKQKNKKLQAQVQALRGALERIASLDLSPNFCCPNEKTEKCSNDIKTCARPDLWAKEVLAQTLFEPCES